MTTVSLIVPCYNAAKTLRPCLEAVLAQTRRPDEIVVVDDASGDGSAAIAAAQGCRVVRLPENRGVSAARNAGVAATTGDVVFFLDSDVALRPDAVENALRVLDDDPERGCVQGVYEPEPLIDDGPAEWYRILHAAYWRRRHLGDVTGVVFALAAIRRDVLRAVGPFDETLRDCEDVEYGGRLAGTCRVVLTDAVRGHHDDASRLLPILAEQWRRAVPLVPLALAASRRGGGQPEHANRPAGILACALAMATLPAGLLHPALLALPLALLACFAAADPGLLRFVHRRRGAAFTAYFMTVHLAVHMVLVSGLAAGSLRLLPGLRRAQSTAALR
ncbi:glycosyltransferase [Actinomadura madurae]|uniref:glycosyltransferase family 2 protein n=1 Tax=Actinomadura madurae TaxID=1993 RepID=UPI0020269F7F|nr:glycosyltransferase family 2 protein [Actinomadura madurae]MCP9952615.1 glycosyltransferase [Actinomadura madurae]URM98131.1 glycosyltransferase [Actinomadura madurae]URN08819.1 glycosyltransferase [Actinomadura madurae]